MNCDIGSRVGAILSADEKAVRFLGYGRYLGDLGVALQMDDREPPIIIQNPCIHLDSGRYVWGMQCWWAGEARIRDFIGGKEVIPVEIDNVEPCDTIGRDE